MDERRILPFGKLIRELRVAKRLSQRDVAQRVDIDFTYLSKIENSRAAPPSDEVIRNLARVLEADPEELLALAAKVSQEDLRKTVAADPRVGMLFRRLQSGTLGTDQIEKMLRIVGAEEKEGPTEHE